MSILNKKSNFSTVVGDLFATEDSVIGHGTNTQGAMASGIAVIFKREFPKMHDEYMKLCDTEGSNLFGTTQFVKLDESEAKEHVKYVANIFSQDKPGKDASYAGFLRALDSLFVQMFVENYKNKDVEGFVELKNVSIPRIGCGIGGLEWEIVEVLLEDYMNRLQPDFNLTVVIHPSDV